MAIPMIKPAVGRSCEAQTPPFQVQQRPNIDRYIPPELYQAGKGLLAVFGCSLGILGALTLCKGGVRARFLSAVRWTVSPTRFNSPITLHETELLTGFKLGTDGFYQIEKLMIGSHSRALSEEPLAQMVTEASAWRFSYKARAETIRFVSRDNGSISLSFVDVAGEQGEVVFGEGTPWHRFLVDNQTLWKGNPTSSHHASLAERVAALLTSPGSASFNTLESGGAVSLAPSVRGVTGNPVSPISRVYKKDGSYAYAVREIDRMGAVWDIEVDLSRAYLSTPVPGWFKVSFGHRPLYADYSLNGSILVHKETRSGRILEGFPETCLATDEEGVYRLPKERFEMFLGALANFF